MYLRAGCHWADKGIDYLTLNLQREYRPHPLLSPLLLRISLITTTWHVKDNCDATTHQSIQQVMGQIRKQEPSSECSSPLPFHLLFGMKSHYFVIAPPSLLEYLRYNHHSFSKCVGFVVGARGGPQVTAGSPIFTFFVSTTSVSVCIHTHMYINIQSTYNIVCKKSKPLLVQELTSMSFCIMTILNS